MRMTQNLFVLILIHLFAIAPAGCTPPSSDGGIHHITATQARSLIERNAGSSEFEILDVRTPREYRMGHIAGAVLLDFHSPEFVKRLQGLDPSKTYLIYCHTGYRSSRTLTMIGKMGFATVYHLQRGIVEWHALKLPLVRS